MGGPYFLQKTKIMIFIFYKIENNQLIERYTPDNWDGVDFSFLSNQETQDTIYFKCDKRSHD